MSKAQLHGLFENAQASSHQDIINDNVQNALCGLLFSCVSYRLFSPLLSPSSPEGKDVSTSTAGGGNSNNNNNGNNNGGTNNNNNNGGGGSSPAGTTPSSATSSAVQPKWPIKPGVHLHVNGLHSLGKSVKPINGFSYGTKHSTSTLPHNASSASNTLQSPPTTTATATVANNGTNKTLHVDSEVKPSQKEISLSIYYNDKASRIKLKNRNERLIAQFSQKRRFNKRKHFIRDTFLETELLISCLPSYYCLSLFFACFLLTLLSLVERIKHSLVPSNNNNNITVFIPLAWLWLICHHGRHTMLLLCYMFAK